MPSEMCTTADIKVENSDVPPPSYSPADVATSAAPISRKEDTMHNGDGIAFDFRFIANAGSPRDLDFSVPDLRLLHDHIQGQNSDAANYLAGDLPAVVTSGTAEGFLNNTNTSPKRKRAGGSPPHSVPP